MKLLQETLEPIKKEPIKLNYFQFWAVEIEIEETLLVIFSHFYVYCLRIIKIKLTLKIIRFHRESNRILLVPSQEFHSRIRRSVTFTAVPNYGDNTY